MSDNFGNTRTKVAQFFYRRLQKSVKQTNKIDFKFNKVKSIGIIFDKNSKGVNSLIKKLYEELNKNSALISIYKLAYNIEEVDRPEQVEVPIVYFTDDDLNWYGKPKFKDVENFLETPFDLLINLASNDSWGIKFSIMLSKAKFKVGKLEANSDVYDFMINNSEGTNSEDLNNVIVDYLRIINN